jgi:DNA-directed RNA polymerase beta' subunit
VITPDPLIRLHELGVPIEFCMKLTVPETVGYHNFERLQSAVRNGYYVYPGAKFIELTRSNVKKYLIFHNNETNELYASRLEFGDVVHRHMIEGGYLINNRQPSLHKMGFMAHRVVPMPGKTNRMSADVTTPYNADFDGDEMNLHVPQSLITSNEIKELASVQTQIISPSLSKPIIAMVQDSLLGAYLLSVTDELNLSAPQLMNALTWCTSLPASSCSSSAPLFLPRRLD